MRKKLLIGNWKLHQNQSSAREFVALVRPKVSQVNVDLAVAPTAPMLGLLSSLLANSELLLSAQNVFYEDSGAYTGEWSAQQLAELNVSYCIVGHSERRSIFFETDEQVNKKALACLRAHIAPVICVGESEKERMAGQTNEIIRRQVNASLNGMSNTASKLIFAYEPIWAIGTGKTATAFEAQNVHHWIRNLIKERLGEGISQQVRILYGGSVNPSNIKEIVKMPDVDGSLVGGASLQASSFLSMVEELQ